MLHCLIKQCNYAFAFLKKKKKQNKTMYNFGSGAFLSFQNYLHNKITLILLKVKKKTIKFAQEGFFIFFFF